MTSHFQPTSHDFNSDLRGAGASMKPGAARLASGKTFKPREVGGRLWSAVASAAATPLGSGNHPNAVVVSLCRRTRNIPLSPASRADENNNDLIQGWRSLGSLTLATIFHAFGVRNPVAKPLRHSPDHVASSNSISSLKPKYSQRNNAIGTLPFSHK